MSMFLMSDGRVPEHSGLCWVRWRADLFHSAAFCPARDNRGIVLLALAPLLVPLVVPVRRRRSLQMSLQVRVLPGANFHAQGAFPLDLLEHGGISTDPGHLGHLRGGVLAKHDGNITISNTPCVQQIDFQKRSSKACLWTLITLYQYGLSVISSIELLRKLV